MRSQPANIASKQTPLSSQCADKRADGGCRYDSEAQPEHASARLWDDGVIDPADTRRVLGMALEAASQGRPADIDSTFGVFRM